MRREIEETNTSKRIVTRTREGDLEDKHHEERKEGVVPVLVETPQQDTEKLSLDAYVRVCACVCVCTYVCVRMCVRVSG